MFDAVTYGAAVGAAKKYTDEHSGSDDAVKYTEQSLTSEQQAQARENIGAAASDDIPTDAVKYTAQTLTAAQQAQARTNIGAGTSSFSGSYSDLTNAPPLVKGNGTGGNTIGGTGINTNSARFANSVAYGNIVSADANYAFAFGERVFAGKYPTGKHAVAIGKNVRAEKDYEIAFGTFNQSNADTAFSIGDGTSDSDRHNLIELKTDGTLLLNGNAVKTADATDNKLRLGQIHHVYNADGATTRAKYTYSKGFAGIFGTSPTTITFSTDVVQTFSETTDKVAIFKDFAGYVSNTTIYVKPTSVFIGTQMCVENGYYMFSGCTSLTTISSIFRFDTSECRDMTQMFYDCKALTTLNLASFDMTNVTAYDKMFGEASHWAGITNLFTPKINPHNDIPLPRTLYSQDGTAYTNLPVTTGTSIELRQSWT